MHYGPLLRGVPGEKMVPEYLVGITVESCCFQGLD